MSEKHLSTQFDAELNHISGMVMEMGGLVEQQMRQAVEATGPGHGRTQGQYGRRSGQAREGGMVLKKLAHVHKSGILAPGSAPPGQESQS